MAMNIDDDDVQGAQSARLTDRLVRIGKDCARYLKEPFRSVDPGTILYDDQ